LPIIAQRFIAGHTSTKRSKVPIGTAEKLSAVSPTFLPLPAVCTITHIVNKACDAAPTQTPKVYTLHVQAVTKPTLFTDKKFKYQEAV
jgi:hypothetical protein